MKSYNARRRFRSAIHAVQLVRFLTKLSHDGHDGQEHGEHDAHQKTHENDGHPGQSPAPGPIAIAEPTKDKDLKNNVLTSVIRSSNQIAIDT